MSMTLLTDHHTTGIKGFFCKQAPSEGVFFVGKNNNCKNTVSKITFLKQQKKNYKCTE